MALTTFSLELYWSSSTSSAIKSPRQETRAFTRGTTLINGNYCHSLSQVRDYSDTRLSLKGKSLLTLLALAFVERSKAHSLLLQHQAPTLYPGSLWMHDSEATLPFLSVYLFSNVNI